MFVYCPPKELPVLESVTQPDGKRYYVSPSGKKLPSVTTVMGAMKKQAIMEWRNAVGEEEANRVSKYASGRGNRVHALAEKYLKNDPIQWMREMPDAVAMFRSMVPHMHRINNIHYIEQALWSERIGLAGRVDLIAEWDGVLSVIDFKTSSRVKERDDIHNYFEPFIGGGSVLLEVLKRLEKNEISIFGNIIVGDINGDLIVTGNITAQQFIISSSILSLFWLSFGNVLMPMLVVIKISFLPIDVFKLLDSNIILNLVSIIFDS